MAEKATTKSTKSTTVEKVATVKLTPGTLVSKANYIVRVLYNGQSLFIQPFGKVKVIKENVVVEPIDAAFITFVKD